MNIRFLKIAGLLGALGVFTLAANAQSAVARATVPFEFAAGGAMMPAGDYTVEASDLSGVILVRGTASSVALFTTYSGTLPNTGTAKLIFERRDGMVYLSSVAWPDQSVHVVSAFKHVNKGVVAAALR